MRINKYYQLNLLVPFTDFKHKKNYKIYYSIIYKIWTNSQKEIKLKLKLKKKIKL